MKAAHYFKSFLLLAGFFLLNACQEDDVNEPNGIKITFQAVTGLQNSADTLLIEEALIGIASIDFKREGEADSAVVEKVVYNGPYVADLLNGTVSPSIRWIFAEPGFYRKIDVTTHNTLPQGNTIVLKGTFIPADGEGEIPFELVTSRNYTLEIANSTGITIRDGENVDLLVIFELSELFRGVDLNDFDKNEQGVVVISEDEGVAAVTSVVNAFEAFSSFGINDGLPFPERENENPENETPDEVETPGDDNNDEKDEQEGSSDDEQDDDSSGDESEDSGNNNGGSTDEDENEESSGDQGNGGSGNNNEDNPGSDNGDEPADDEEEVSENDEEENPVTETDNEETDTNTGNDDGQDSGSGSQDEEDAGNNQGDQDDEDDNSSDDDDDGNDDDDGDDDDERDDDQSDDDDSDDDDDEEKEEKDKGKKDKGDKGKGNNGNSDRGKKK